MFFKEFPKTLYSFDFKNDSPTVIANIFSRFKIRSSVLNNTVAFYKYQLQAKNPTLRCKVVTKPLVERRFGYVLHYVAGSLKPET